MLFSEPQRPSYFGRSKRVEIYAPRDGPQPRHGQLREPAAESAAECIRRFDWQKGAALGELKIAAKSGTDKKSTNVFEAMYQMASGWSLSPRQNQRDRSWEMARLLAAHYIGEKDFDKASEVLAALRKAGFEEAGWFNVAIYLAPQKARLQRHGETLRRTATAVSRQGARHRPGANLHTFAGQEL